MDHHVDMRVGRGVDWERRLARLTVSVLCILPCHGLTAPALALGPTDSATDSATDSTTVMADSTTVSATTVLTADARQETNFTTTQDRSALVADPTGRGMPDGGGSPRAVPDHDPPGGYVLSMPLAGSARDRLEMRAAVRPASTLPEHDTPMPPIGDHEVVASVASLDQAWSWIQSVLGEHVPPTRRPARPEAAVRLRHGPTGGAPGALVTMSDMLREGLLGPARWLVNENVHPAERPQATLPRPATFTFSLDGTEPVHLGPHARRCAPEDSTQHAAPQLRPPTWRCVDWVHVIGQRSTTREQEAGGMLAGYVPAYMIAPGPDVGTWQCHASRSADEPVCVTARTVGASRDGVIVEVWRVDADVRIALVELPVPVPAPALRGDPRGSGPRGSDPGGNDPVVVDASLQDEQVFVQVRHTGASTSVSQAAWIRLRETSPALRTRLGIDRASLVGHIEHVEHE